MKAMVYFEGSDLATLIAAIKNILIAAASAVRDFPHGALLSRDLATPLRDCPSSLLFASCSLRPQ